MKIAVAECLRAELGVGAPEVAALELVAAAEYLASCGRGHPERLRLIAARWWGPTPPTDSMSDIHELNVLLADEEPGWLET